MHSCVHLADPGHVSCAKQCLLYANWNKNSNEEVSKGKMLRVKKMPMALTKSFRHLTALRKIIKMSKDV